MNARPEEPPVKLLPKRGNIPRAKLHQKRNFPLKGNTTVVKMKSTGEKGVKQVQQTVLPSVNKGPQKTQKDFSHTQQTLQPSISKKKTQLGPSLYQYTVLPPICLSSQKTSHQHAGQEPGCTKTSKTPPKETTGAKAEQQRETPALCPENVLGDFQSCLTELELEEIKGYKHVWYLGKEANKTRCSNVTETQDISSGYDTEDGLYRVIINDHLAYRFEILEVIGTGYSGQVLKCMDHKTMELVAIKVMRSKENVHQLGKAEVKILKALRELDKYNTANIVHMKENFYFRNHLCITFELFEKDLYKALKGTKACGLSEKEVKQYTIDVLKCLQLLREKRMIHGDIKPDNILLYKKGVEKRTAVCDFGGSYFVRHRDQPIIHTLFYISPEMLLGKRCSPATDMWSLGCTVAELHLGHCLFSGCNTADQFCCIMKVLGVPPRGLLVEAPKRHLFFQSNGIPLKMKDIKHHSSTLPKQLNSKSVYFVDFVKRCLEYDPTERITPEKALQHPWLHEKKAKPFTRKTTSDAPYHTTSRKPALLRREKMPPVQLKPIMKPKAKNRAN